MFSFLKTNTLQLLPLKGPVLIKGFIRDRLDSHPGHFISFLTLRLDYISQLSLQLSVAMWLNSGQSKWAEGNHASPRLTNKLFNPLILIAFLPSSVGHTQTIRWKVSRPSKRWLSHPRGKKTGYINDYMQQIMPSDSYLPALLGKAEISLLCWVTKIWGCFHNF